MLHFDRLSARRRLWSIGSAAVAVWLLSTSGATILPAGAQAEQAFNAGVAEYRRKHFQKALAYFQQASRINPYSPDALYYQALSYQQLHNNKQAVKIYAQLVSRFSYSQAGKLAGTALMSLDPNYARQLMSSGSSATMPSRPAATHSSVQTYQSYGGGGSSTENLPDQSRIRYEQTGSLLKIIGQINGRQQEMIFDTGAAMTVFGKNHLRALGVQVPTGPPTSSASGVGSNSTVPTWSMTATVKVGDIERKNFPIIVQDELPTLPLLGQTFFSDFQYTIHPTAHEILFIKKGSAPQTAGDRNSVPFTREGNDLVVTAEVNGHTMPMYFDTGASTCAFTKAQLRQAGIPIPEDAVSSQNVGIGGTTNSLSFTVRRMKLGPIDKSDVSVAAIESANMRYPLLGQSFFSDWQCTVDNANHQIHFLRR